MEGYCDRQEVPRPWHECRYTRPPLPITVPITVCHEADRCKMNRVEPPEVRTRWEGGTTLNVSSRALPGPRLFHLGNIVTLALARPPLNCCSARGASGAVFDFGGGATVVPHDAVVGVERELEDFFRTLGTRSIDE